MLTPSPVDWMVPASVNAPAPRIEILLEDCVVSMRAPLSISTLVPPDEPLTAMSMPSASSRCAVPVIVTICEARTTSVSAAMVLAMLSVAALNITELEESIEPVTLVVAASNVIGTDSVLPRLPMVIVTAGSVGRFWPMVMLVKSEPSAAMSRWLRFSVVPPPVRSEASVLPLCAASPMA